MWSGAQILRTKKIRVTRFQKERNSNRNRTKNDCQMQCVSKTNFFIVKHRLWHSLTIYGRRLQRIIVSLIVIYQVSRVETMIKCDKEGRGKSLDLDWRAKNSVLCTKQPSFFSPIHVNRFQIPYFKSKNRAEYTGQLVFFLNGQGQENASKCR